MPKSPFQTLDEKVEESRFAKFDKTMALTREIFKQIRSNALGQPSGEWVNPQRQPGSVQPGIYAPPGNEWLLGEVDAFHGGGKFAKFSDDFMKTGTGGHVFGWGHYVSEEKGVGKYYHDLYARDNIKNIENTLDNLSDKQIDDFRRLFSEEYDVRNVGKAFIDDVKEEIGIGGSGVSRHVAEMLDDIGVKQAGLYKVKVFKGKDPSEYTFLDWDKPVDEKILKNIKSEYIKYRREITGRNASDDFITEQEIGNLFEPVKKVDPKNWMHPPDEGQVIYKKLSELLGSKEAASKFLERAGISGIRYPVGSLSGATPKAKIMINGKEYNPRSNSATPYLREMAEKYDGDKNKMISQLEKEIDSFVDEYNKVLQETVTKPDHMKLHAKKTLREYKKGISDLGDHLNAIVSAKTFEVTPIPKNYVIFNPKNIEIEETIK
jgi:hypothetical protein